MEKETEQQLKQRAQLFTAMLYDYGNVEPDIVALKEYIKNGDDKWQDRITLILLKHLAEVQGVVVETMKEIEQERKEELWRMLTGESTNR